MKYRLFLVVALLLIGRSVRAAGAAESDVANARAHHDAGLRFYEGAQYDQALQEFRAAYALDSNPARLIDIAQSLRKLGHLEEALATYRNFLQLAPRASNRAAVERSMKEVEAGIARPSENGEGGAAAPEMRAPPPSMSSTPPHTRTTLSSPALPAWEAPSVAAQSKPLIRQPWFWGALALVAAVAVGNLLFASRHTERRFSCADCFGASQVPTR